MDSGSLKEKALVSFYNDDAMVLDYTRGGPLEYEVVLFGPFVSELYIDLSKFSGPAYGLYIWEGLIRYSVEKVDNYIGLHGEVMDEMVDTSVEEIWRDLNDDEWQSLRFREKLWP